MSASHVQSSGFKAQSQRVGAREESIKSNGNYITRISEGEKGEPFNTTDLSLQGDTTGDSLPSATRVLNATDLVKMKSLMLCVSYPPPLA